MLHSVYPLRHLTARVLVLQGRKLMVIGTTSIERKLRLQQLGVVECFDFVMRVPMLNTAESIAATFKHSGVRCSCLSPLFFSLMIV